MYNHITLETANCLKSIFTLQYASHRNDEAFRDTMNHKLPKFIKLAQTEEDTEHYLSSTYDIINLVFHDIQ